MVIHPCRGSLEEELDRIVFKRRTQLLAVAGSRWRWANRGQGKGSGHWVSLARSKNAWQPGGQCCRDGWWCEQCADSRWVSEEGPIGLASRIVERGKDRKQKGSQRFLAGAPAWGLGVPSTEPMKPGGGAFRATGSALTGSDTRTVSFHAPNSPARRRSRPLTAALRSTREGEPPAGVPEPGWAGPGLEPGLWSFRAHATATPSLRTQAFPLPVCALGLLTRAADPAALSDPALRAS